MDSQVADIKQKLDAVTVISHYITLTKRGRHFVACCPFHSEKTPSFIVSPELQIFKCFGCGKSGDIYSFVQEFERVDFSEALEILAKEAGVTLVRSRQLSTAESQQKRLLALHTEVARFYHYLLISHPLGKVALDYVLGRHLSLATIKLFQIGYSPKNPQLLVNHLTKKGFSQSELIASGIFGKSQYRSGLYDRFLDRLVFPLHDQRGRIIAFSGRALPGSKPELAKYINSPETDLYHKSHMVYGLHLAKDAIRTSKSVIVTEGEFDMISPYQSGIRNIVAVKGTAFTLEQLQLLHRYTDTLILALDSDFAGNSAAKRSIELADSLEFDIHVLSLGDKYKDPDEAVNHDPQFFQDQLAHPVPIWDFFIQSAVKSYGIDTPRGKRQVLSNTLPFLTKISNSVIRSDYLRQLANLIHSDYQSVVEESKKFTSVSTTSSSPARSPTIPQVEKLEEYLLSLILATQKPIQVATQIQSQRPTFATTRFQAVFSQLLLQQDFDPTTFQSLLPSELQSVFQNLYLLGTSQDFDSSLRQKEIVSTIKQLTIIHLREQLQQLSLKLKQDDTNTQLSTEYQQLISQLSSLQLEKS